MAKAVIAPYIRQQFFNDNGAPLAFGKIYTYAAQSSGATAKDTYKSNSLTDKNTNPIVLDGAGRADIWLSGSYLFSFYDANGSPLYSRDNITGDSNALDGSIVASGDVSFDNHRITDLAAPVNAGDAANKGYVDVIRSAIATGTVSALVGSNVFQTQADLYADLAHADGTFALVWGDPSPTKVDLYRKTGASGAGAWSAPLGIFAAAAQAQIQPLLTTATDTVNSLFDLIAALYIIVDYGPTDLTGGTLGNVSFSYVDGRPVANSITVAKVTVPADLPAGDYELFFATKSGSDFTKTDSYTFTVGGTPHPPITNWNPVITAGIHYRGIRGVTGRGEYHAAGYGQYYVNTAVTAATTMAFVGGYEPMFTVEGRILSIGTRLSALEAATAQPNTQNSLVPLATADKPSLLLTGGWNASIVGGQSLAEGYGNVSITHTQPYFNKTFGSGPRSGKPGNGAGAVNTAPGTSTTIALIENDLSASPEFNTACGETICSIKASQVNTLAMKENGVTPASLVQFVSCDAHGAYAISSLSKGSSAWYNQTTDHISEGIARAKAAGVDYAFHTKGWIQGEADADANTSYATYKAALKQHRIDVETDYHTLLTAAVGGSITAKANPVHLMVMQVSTWGAGATLPKLETIQQAQYDAILEDSRMHLVCPGYFLPRNADGVHLPSASEDIAARYFGRAEKQLLVDGAVPQCFRFISVYAVGTTLTVHCSVPTSPLVLDIINLVQATNYGFVVKDDTGTLALSGISVSGDKIIMTLNRTLSTNPKFRYALDQNGTAVIGLQGNWGNLRDNTNPLPHWAPHTQLNISVLES